MCYIPLQGPMTQVPSRVNGGVKVPTLLPFTGMDVSRGLSPNTHHAGTPQGSGSCT